MYLKRSLKVNKTNLSLSKILCLFLLSSNFYFANKVLSVEILNKYVNAFPDKFKGWLLVE